MIGRVVAIGGPPGSGKSTAGRQVAATLHLEYRSAGEVFRAEAKAHAMDLEAFGHFAESHPEVDRRLDDTMQALARPGVLLDGRIQAALCRGRGHPVYSIVVTAEESERVRRVASRDGQSVDEARWRIRDRAQSERARYLRLYGLDPERETPDLLVDSTALPAPEVAAAISEFLLSRPQGESQ